MTKLVGIFAKNVFMRIGVVQIPHVVQSSLVGPLDMFNQLNVIQQNFRPDIKIPKVEAEIIDFHNLSSSENFDLIILPAMQFNHIENVLENSGDLVNWLIKQYKSGTEIASICLGAFLLAKTGLLNSKDATTHWMGAPLFKKMFPEVNLVDDKFITDNRSIYSSGGAYSFTTLIIYLIEKYFGHDMAVLTSKVFLIHLHDSNQTGYKILNLQKNHNDETIVEIQKYIENNLDKPLLLEDLAQKANLSLRTFIRRFKNATGDTPNVYIRKVRVEKAKKLLENTDTRVEELCFETGYSDFASFRKTFKKIAGQTPSEYKKLYRRPLQNIKN